MLETPFYDPTKSYDDNYSHGPFGAFADGQTYEQSGTPTVTYLGQKVFTPFGIPAGPLINSNFCKAAFEKGFDIAVYKTVRSGVFPCHPFPNILAVHVEGDLTVEKTKTALTADAHYTEPLSITNSFGVPSKDPSVWQEDVRRAIAAAGIGQVLVLSFMGTVKPNQTEDEFVEDYALAAKLSAETEAKILEVNLSCPNIGNEGLVCYNLDVSKKVLAAIRREIGNTPLIVKVGYYNDDVQLQKMAELVNEYANEIAGINTMQAEVRNENGEQALPENNRLRSGICGNSIRWAGLDTVTRLNEIREKNNYSFSICGVGGVMKPEDYTEYRRAGADAVMSATGAMWDPHLAQKIKSSQ